MVKLHRGGKHNGPLLRPMKPRPLFPPGELPLFGPPPAFIRRPLIPPPPVNRGPPMGYGPPPPPPSQMRPPPPHPMRPPPPMMLRPRPGPPPPMPLLQAPVLPPRPPHFLRGGRLDGKPPMMKPGRKMMDERRMKPFKRNIRKHKPKKPSRPANQTSPEVVQKKETPQEKKEEDILQGPWISDAIKAEIGKMNELKKVADEKKDSANTEAYNEQKKKVENMANAAKMEYIGSQPDKPIVEKTVEGKTEEAPTKNGSVTA